MKIKKLTENEILNTLKEHTDILRKYGVVRIGLFGSYVRGEQRENSDIDFEVEFERPGKTQESIRKAYPYLEPEDIQEALNYAALLADEQVIEFAS